MDCLTEKSVILMLKCYNFLVRKKVVSFSISTDLAPDFNHECLASVMSDHFKILLILDPWS